MDRGEPLPLPWGWTTGWDSHYGRPYFIRPDLTTTWEDPRQFHNPHGQYPQGQFPTYPAPPMWSHSTGKLSQNRPLPPRTAKAPPKSPHNPTQHRRASVLITNDTFNDESENTPLIPVAKPVKESGKKKKTGSEKATPTQQLKTHSTRTKPSLPPPATQKTSKKNIYSFSSSTLNLGNPEFPKSRRYCCNCFRSRSGCRRFWIIFTILLLGGLAAAGFFLWPRYPRVTVSDPVVPEGAQAFVMFGKLETASPETPFVMQMNVVVEVKVWSENYWDILMEKLTFEGNLLDGSGNSLESTRASGIANGATFKKMENTLFQLPISIRHTVTSPTPVAAILNADPATALLATSCGILDRSKRSNLQISYKARVFITPISWFGLVPEQDGRVSFPCPIPQNAFDTFLKLL